jgi:selenocysteine lyase/cysteine desulfurase
MQAFATGRHMIPSQRGLFDIPGDIAYLNCAYLGPLSHATVAAGREAAARKARPWEIGAADFFGDTEIARALFAKIVNADAQDVALVPAASYGVSVAARNLPVARGQRIVTLAEQFPSNIYAWRESASAADADLVAVQRPGDGAMDDDLTRAILDAIDERTAIVALPNCHWADGALLDLHAISERTRALGAAHRQDGKPLEYNWRQRLGSENFAGLVNYRDEYQPGALRFDVGECANFHTMPALIKALEQILEWGVAEIAETLAARTADIARRAAVLDLQSLDAGARAGHFLGLRFPRAVPDGLLDTLAETRVFLSVRGASLRITPHVYNDDTDVDRLMQALERSLG